MLLDKLSKDAANYPHIVAAMQHPIETIDNQERYFIIHSLLSDIYLVECEDASFLPDIISTLKKINPDLLETTNTTIYKELADSFENSYQCVQFSFPPSTALDPNIKYLSSQDLPYVIATYHEEAYLKQLFDRNRILGYYLEEKLVGYIVHHIDDTLGAIYVPPEYRRHGYGARLIQAALSTFQVPVLYSQVVMDNQVSIQLHTSLQAHRSDKLINWMHNKGFSF